MPQIGFSYHNILSFLKVTIVYIFLQLLCYSVLKRVPEVNNFYIFNKELGEGVNLTNIIPSLLLRVPLKRFLY